MLYMIKNNAFLKIFIFIGLAGCAGTETQETPPQAIPPQVKAPVNSNEYVDRALNKLKPHLKGYEDSVAGYRKIYVDFLSRYPDQPFDEKVNALSDMVDETIQTLDSKDVKDRKCVIDRDFLSAEIMPMLTEIEALYRRHLNKAALPATEIADLKVKVKALNDFDGRIAKLCKPYKDTLRLLNNEARLDAGYILNGGSAPGRAIPDQDSEVDELLNEGN
jgi:hypothetical protein